MHIKRFRGNTLAETLRKVRRMLGEEAVILSSSAKHGQAEILAAVDFEIEETNGKSKAEDKMVNSLNTVREELSSLRCLFSSFVTGKTGYAPLKGGEEAFDLYNRMISNGMDERFARSIISSSIKKADGQPGKIEEICRDSVNESLDIANPFKGFKKPNIIAFVGPTGAGKTTTIAKLALRINRESKNNVGVVSLDIARPGANETLRECSKGSGIPLHIAGNKREFLQNVDILKEKKFLFVDTPGRSPRDTESIQELKDILNVDLPIKSAMVLNSTISNTNLYDVCESFKTIPINFLVFTRVDETRQFGAIFNAASVVKKPVAFVCNGQKIPQDIGIPSSDFLGKLILQGVN